MGEVGEAGKVGLEIGGEDEGRRGEGKMMDGSNGVSGSGWLAP